MLPPTDELRRLIDRLIEEVATPAEVARLEELLADPAAEAYYVVAMADHAALRRLVGGRAAVPRVPAVADRPSRRRRWRRAAVGLAALAASVLVATWAVRRPTPPPATPAAAEPSDDSIALLARQAGAEWGPDGMAVRPGGPLRPGRLSLTAGVARVEFYSGVVLILEGPAELELIDARTARCDRGRVRGYVPPTATGFVVETPAARLVDRGTEFGLAVTDGKTEVHCFRGRVDVYDPAGGATPVELAASQAVRRGGPAGGVGPMAADPAAFVSRAELARRSRDEVGARAAAAAPAAAAWAADPACRVYLTFDDADPDAGGAVANRAADPTVGPGAAVGVEPADGRWPGDGAVEFKRVGDRVLFAPLGDADALTLAAWVRADALEYRYNSLFMTAGWPVGSPHWHVSDAGRLALGVRVSEPRGTNYLSPPVFTPDRLGQWTHVAVVYDPAARRVTHYADGRVVSREAIRHPARLRIGPAQLGNWDAAERAAYDRQPLRNLVGRVAEFAAFARPLSDAEVARHAAGRPPAGP